MCCRRRWPVPARLAPVALRRRRNTCRPDRPSRLIEAGGPFRAVALATAAAFVVASDEHQPRHDAFMPAEKPAFVRIGAEALARCCVEQMRRLATLREMIDEGRIVMRNVYTEKNQLPRHIVCLTSISDTQSGFIAAA